MSTFLFDKTIFGPIHSRRLGISLGVNLLPNDRKVCSFDCIYCECGFGQKGSMGQSKFPSREDVRQMLEEKLVEMSGRGELPDVITFAGNGEPTLHPEFAGVIDDTIALRNEYCSSARVAVLSNASMIGRESVAEALRKVDDNILKLDSASEEIVNELDRPNYKYSVEETVNLISSFGENLAVQTMFARWRRDNGEMYDNSREEDVEAWLQLIKRINPPRLMIYTIDRETPMSGMEKVSKERLDAIAEEAKKYVREVSVSY